MASVTAKKPSTSKPLINMGLGDPTALAPPPPNVNAAVIQRLQENASNGYLPGPGSLAARQAVADYHLRWDNVAYPPTNIFLMHGASHSLDMIWNVLVPVSADTTLPGRPNVLVPRPGFAQYTTFLNTVGAEIRYYDCLEEQNWECDLETIREGCDENTKAILITNPSNPCGSNFSKAHLEALLDIAEEAKVPIIADEIYGHMVSIRAIIARLRADARPLTSRSSLSPH